MNESMVGGNGILRIKERALIIVDWSMVLEIYLKSAIAGVGLIQSKDISSPDSKWRIWPILIDIQFICSSNGCR